MLRKEVQDTYEGSLRRRNFITGGIATAAIAAFGVDAGFTLARRDKIKKEIEEIRPQISEEQINNTHELVNQYNNCQKVTDNRCEEVMQPRQVAEVREAELAVKEHNIFIQESKKRLSPEEDRLKLGIIGALLALSLTLTGRWLFETYEDWKNF